MNECQGTTSTSFFSKIDSLCSDEVIFGTYLTHIAMWFIIRSFYQKRNLHVSQMLCVYAIVCLCIYRPDMDTLIRMWSAWYFCVIFTLSFNCVSFETIIISLVIHVNINNQFTYSNNNSNHHICPAKWCATIYLCFLFQHDVLCSVCCRFISCIDTQRT